MPLKTKLEILSDDKLARVHDASLKILSETGVLFKCPEALEIFKKHGARVDGEVAFLPRKMVEKAIEEAPATFRFQGRNEAHSVIIGEGFAVQPNGGVVDIQDMGKGRRPALLADFTNIQKLCQASNIVSLVGSFPVEPRDVEPQEKHLKVTHAIIKHTDKPIISYCSYTPEVRQMIDMVEIATGKKKFLEDHYAVAVSVNPLSPLKYSTDASETMIEFAKRKQPVFILSCRYQQIFFQPPIHEHPERGIIIHL